LFLGLWVFLLSIRWQFNSNLNGVLPKFNSLLGTRLSAYVKVESTVNSDISIVPASNFTWTAVTNAQNAVNLPSLKADPNLVLSLFANPPEMSLESGAAGARNATASATVSRSYSEPQSLNMFSGCAGDLMAASIVATGNVKVLGTQLELMRVQLRLTQLLLLPLSTSLTLCRNRLRSRVLV
jgi:hypothetical protein